MPATIDRQTIARELAALLAKPLLPDSPGSRHGDHLILEHYPHRLAAGSLGSLLLQLRSPYPEADVPEAILATEKDVAAEVAAEPASASAAREHLARLARPLEAGALCGHRLSVQQEIDGRRTQVEATTNREGRALFSDIFLHLACQLEALPETWTLVWNPGRHVWVACTSPVRSHSAAGQSSVQASRSSAPQTKSRYLDLIELGRAATIVGGFVLAVLAAGPAPLGGVEPLPDVLEIGIEPALPQPVKLQIVISQKDGGWLVEVRGAADLPGPLRYVELFSEQSLPLRRMLLGDAQLTFPCPFEALAGQWGLEFSWLESGEWQTQQIALPPLGIER